MTAFSNEEAAPATLEGFADRAQANLPDDFLPDADKVMVAGPFLISSLDYPEPYEAWEKSPNYNAFRSFGFGQCSPEDRERLIETYVEQHGHFWFISRMSTVWATTNLFPRSRTHRSAPERMKMRCGLPIIVLRM